MSTKDTTLPLGGGPDGKSPLFIPARTNIIYLVWSMHRRTDLYGPDAADFRPERWETIRPGWEYLPFNGGPRICIGRTFFPSLSFSPRSRFPVPILLFPPLEFSPLFFFPEPHGLIRSNRTIRPNRSILHDRTPATGVLSHRGARQPAVAGTHHPDVRDRAGHAREHDSVKEIRGVQKWAINVFCLFFPRLHSEGDGVEESMILDKSRNHSEYVGGELPRFKA